MCYVIIHLDIEKGILMKGVAMENDYLYDNDLLGAFSFDRDDLKMHGRRYLKTGICNTQYYNVAYAQALEIIGLLYCAYDNSKNGNYHKGVAYIAERVGVSKAEIKSLRKNFKWKKDMRIYKIPYNTSEIVQEISELLKNKVNEPVVKNFLDKQNKSLYVLILINKQYYLVKAVSKLDPKISNLYNALKELG